MTGAPGRIWAWRLPPDDVRASGLGYWHVESPEGYEAERYVRAKIADEVRETLLAENEYLASMLAGLRQERNNLLEAARRLRTAWHPEQRETAIVLLDAAIARCAEVNTREPTGHVFGSLEDADAHAFPVGATIGIRSHSAGMLFYKLMQAENGEPFWRLTDEPVD